MPWAYRSVTSAASRGSREVLLDVVEHPEVRKCEAGGAPALRLDERPFPGLQVDLGRGCRREHEVPGGYPHANRVAGVQRPVRMQVGNVVACMALTRKAVQSQHIARDELDVPGRHGCDFPHSASNSAPKSRRALASSRLGSTRCGAPISETWTWSAGLSRTSTPDAPAWSKWMCVSRRWRMSASEARGRRDLVRVQGRCSPGRSRRWPAHRRSRRHTWRRHAPRHGAGRSARSSAGLVGPGRIGRAVARFGAVRVQPSRLPDSCRKAFV